MRGCRGQRAHMQEDVAPLKRCHVYTQRSASPLIKKRDRQRVPASHAVPRRGLIPLAVRVLGTASAALLLLHGLPGHVDQGCKMSLTLANTAVGAIIRFGYIRGTELDHNQACSTWGYTWWRRNSCPVSLGQPSNKERKALVGIRCKYWQGEMRNCALPE